MPLVSVVIPTRGRPVLLARAIATVLEQTIADIEVIVVIDGEDPDTVARLAAIDDARLRSHVNPAPLGAGVARNVGAGLATGRWIAFLDDDDEWLPTKLERQLALPMPSSGRVIISCQSAYVTPRGTSVRPRAIFDNRMPIDEWLFDRRQMFGGQSFIQTSSLLMPRALFEERNFPAHGQHEDWEFVIDAVKRLQIDLITVPEILVRHYAEEQRASLSSGGRLEGSLNWINRMRGLVSKRAYSGFCLTVIAHQARRDGGWRAFATLLKLAFRHGRPTAVQLAVFVTVWAIPPGLHAALRRLRPPVAASPQDAVASAQGQLAS